MKKVLDQQCVFIVLVLCMSLWCAGSLAVPILARINEPLTGLSGAIMCHCDNCSTDTKLRYECRHTTMDANVPCDTDTCLKDKLYFAKCQTLGAGQPCNVTYSGTALMGEQWRHWVTAGNKDCETVDQEVIDDFFDEQDCEVINSSGVHQGRCEISAAACNGGLVYTCPQRKGRDVCP